MTTTSAKDKSRKALMLSTKVKSFRNSMNPYQLGDSSNRHPRNQLKHPLNTTDDSSNQDDVDIGTDIDESADHFDDDESSFAEDTGGVEYLLGGGQEDEVSSDQEDRKISSPGSPSSVIDLFPTDSNQKSRGSRSSDRRKTVSGCRVASNIITVDGDNGSTGTPEATKKARRRSTQTNTSGGQSSLMVGDKKERAANQDKAGKKGKRGKKQGEDQRRRSSKRMIESDTDDTADSAGKSEASTRSRGRTGREDDGGRTSGEETLSPIRKPPTTRRQKKDILGGSEQRKINDLLGPSEHRNSKTAPRKPRRQQPRRGSTGSVAENSGLEDASDKALLEVTSERKKRGEEKRPRRDSLSRGSSHRRMLGKGSNHSDKRSKSRRASRSVNVGSNNERIPATSEKRKETAAISTTNSKESRKEKVLKKRREFINQKSAVRPIVRRASRSRRASVQDLPPVEPAEPIVGHGHSFSGSVSSLTISTGAGSKDDFSLPSPGVFSRKKAFPRDGTTQERKSPALSRWQALPKGTPNTSSDGTPTPPSHDLSSLCSPGVLSQKHRTFSPLPLSSHSEHCASHTTPSSLTKNSSLSSSIQSLALEDKQFNGSSRNRFCPEIMVPETPTRSMAGVVSELSTPAGMVSALTTPGTKDGSQDSSLHSKLKLLSSRNPMLRIGEAATPGGHVSELTTTPCLSKNVGPDLRSRLMEATQKVPVTPSLPIGVGGCELDTPGGVVSELTVGSLLSGSSSLASHDRQRNKLSSWMTNVQSVMLNESEYHCRDGIPKMARRHSFDSVSYIEEEDNPTTTESDFAPKAPARQVSFSSMLL